MERTAIRAGLVAVFATALMGPWASPAVAGGGCHAGMTQGQGDRVEMVKACFTPSVLRTDPGTEVTFVNRDPIVHNVSAGEWSYFSDLGRGDEFTATFSQPGVYPFACTYHPGMVGAVVVGDGTGAGSGRTVTVGEDSESEVQASSGQAGDRAAVRPASGDGASLGWLAGGAGGLALGAGVVLGAGWLVRRKRARA
jgi:plastocyanin